MANRLAELEERSIASTVQRSNRLADLETRVLSAPPIDGGKQFDRALDIAVQTGQPMGVVETFLPEIDLDFAAVKPGKIPADPYAVDPAWSNPDERIRLREQISRMDGADVFTKIPFSPYGMQESAEIAAAAARLKSDDYAGAIARKTKELAALTQGIGGYEMPIAGPDSEGIKTALRSEDTDRIQKYILDRMEVARRGQTFGAKVFDGLSYLPAWMIEFSLTGGLAKIGSESARTAVTRTLQGYATTTAGRAALQAAGWTGGAITRTTLGLPLRVADQIIERRIDHFTVGPNGEVSIATPAESWATSIAKGYGQVFIEAATESAGEQVFKPVAGFAKGQIRRLPFGSRFYDATRQAYLAIHPEPGAAANFAERFFTRAGYDGLLEEIGEERLSTILNGLAGTQDFGAGPDAGPLDRIRAGLAQDLELQNMATEIAVLAVPGSIKAGIAHAGDLLGPRIKAATATVQEIADTPRKGPTDGMQGQEEGQGAVGELPPPAGIEIGQPSQMTEQEGGTIAAGTAGPAQFDFGKLPAGTILFAPKQLWDQIVHPTIEPEAAAGPLVAVRGAPIENGPVGQPSVQGGQPAEAGPAQPESPVAREARIEELEVDDGTPLYVARQVNPAFVDFKEGDASRETAGQRAVSMVDAIEKGVALPPPRLKMKPDGRYEVEDGNARVTAYQQTGKAFDAIIVSGYPAPAATERESFQGPQYFTYEDYAARMVEQSMDVRAAARLLGLQIPPGESPDTAAKLVGGAIEDYTSRPEPAPVIEGEPHPGSLSYPQFYQRYGIALAEARNNTEQQAWLQRYRDPFDAVHGSRGVYRVLQEDWRAGQAWDMFYQLTGQERPQEGTRTSPTPSASMAGQPISQRRAASDEPTPSDWPRTEAEAREIEDEESSVESQAAIEEMLGQAPPADLAGTPADPPVSDAGFIGRVLHNLGIKSLDGYEPISHKDLSRLWRYVQLPFDIARTFRQFAPVYKVQRDREIAKQVMDRAFAEKLKPYFDLDDTDRKPVDELLIAQEQQPGNADLTAGLLAALTRPQYAAYTAVRDSLDGAAQILIDRMRMLGVPEERIQEFAGRIGSYIPHKWYGGWRVVVTEKDADGRKRTAYMSGVRYNQRFQERERLQALFPGAQVDVLKATKMDYEAFQDAPQWAVSHMLDVIAEQAQVSAQKKGKPYDPATATEMRKAFEDLYKSKGFGMHFISRAETPGWTENLRQPLAEYFAGFSGFLTKMEAAMAFTEAVEAIDPKKTPNLYKYASEYIRYVMGDEYEWGNVKTAMYGWYLVGNLKSAVVNVSGNLMMGWPELAKRTNWSLAKLMSAMADTASGRVSDAEQTFLSDLEAKGYLDPKMTAEISARGGNAIYRMTWGKGKEAISFVDIFRRMERWNRQSMAVALFRAGVTDPAAAAAAIDEAHFHYGKGNRPPIMRGLLSGATIFRSYTANQITWIKNQVKTGQWGPLGRHMAAWLAVGGVSALPLAAVAKAIYVRAFKRDPEEDMADLIGEQAARMVLGGLPSAAGVSLTGSVAMSDLVPELDPDKPLEWQIADWLGGVAADIPTRVRKVAADLKTRQWARAIEDLSPEAIRNPLAAWRLYSQGATTRRGSPLIDDTGEQLKLTAGEAAKKSLGFQPDRVARSYEKQKMAELLGADRDAIKQQWIDRFYLAQKSGDEEGMRDVIQERAQYEQAMRDRKRPYLIVGEQEIADGVRSRMDPANMPGGSTLRAFLSLYRSKEE